MRTPLLVLLLCTCGPALLFAQCADGQPATVEQLARAAYLANDLAAWDDAATAAAQLPESTANRFRTARVYFGAATTALNKEDDRIDDYLDHLEEALDAVLDADNKHPAATGMYSGYLGLLIAESPMKGMLYGRKSSKLAANGVKYDESDPLALYFRASNLFYTPETWGGNPQRAVEFLRKAISAFPADTAGCDWMLLQTHALLGQALAKTGDAAAARTAYAAALKLEPNFPYVRDYLMPQLAKSGK